MDLTLSDEQQLVADTARELLEARWEPSDCAKVLAGTEGHSTELWNEMAELGWTGLALDEEHGGADAGLLDLCLIIEQMGRAALPTPFVTSTVSCGLPIARYGTDEQKQDHLPALSRGETVLAFAASGSRGGWDVDDPGVVAAAEPDGYRLDGTVELVAYAAAADTLLVVAKVDDGPAILLVDASSPGVEVTRLETVGIDAQYRVELDGVTVGADAVLGSGDDRVAAIEMAVAHTTAAECARMAGGAQKVLDMTVEHASQREQFSAPVGSFQAVQHHCADMAVDVLTARLLAYEAIWALDEGLDAEMEVSVAKAWVSDAYRRVCALGHQVHGAIGFTAEHDLHWYLRHAVDAELSFGDASHHRERVARLLSARSARDR